MQASYPQMKRNFFAFGGDFIFFAAMLGFINFNTVIPAFAAHLGASRVQIGIMITIFLLAWNLPQVIAGNLIAPMPLKKPVLVKFVFLGRPLIVIFTLYLLFSGAASLNLTLIIFILLMVGLWMSDAFAAIAWFDILGRAFPSEKRGGYISYWQIGKGIGLIGVAALVTYILGDSGLAFPYNYAALFGAASLCLMISAYAITLIKEPPFPESETLATLIPWRELGQSLIKTFRSDRRLQQIIFARIFLLLSFMAFPFYVIYATDELLFPEQIIGVFIAAQTVGVLFASFFLGRISDRYGARRVVQIGGSILLTAPMMALAIQLSGQSGLLRYAYVWIYLCMGLADNIMMLGYINYVLDISSDNNRSIYMGITNTIGSIGVFGFAIGGWLLDLSSFTGLFWVSLVLGVIALIFAFRLPSARSAPSSITST